MEMNIHDFVPSLEFLYDAVADSIMGYLYLTDIRSDRICISEKARQDFGFSECVIQNARETWLARIHPRDRDRVDESISLLYSTQKQTFDDEFQMRATSGRYFWVRARGRIYQPPGMDKPTHVIGILENLEQDGEVDRVTGLHTSDRCRRVVESLIAHGQAQQCGILLFNIDDFTRINMLYSHAFGDMVLRTVIQELQALLPEGADLYRLNGDQFLVLCRACSHAKMRELFECLQEYVRHPRSLDGISYQFSISGGVAMLADSGPDWAGLLRNAVLAMRQAKKNGKNRLKIFCPSMLPSTLHEQKLIQELSQSVARGFEGFYLVYQPICTADSLRLVGAEALLRYESPEFGRIRPDSFVPLLEREGLMSDVGMWAFRQAVSVCKTWVEQLPEFTMNVNVSLYQSLGDGFSQRVFQTLNEIGLPPEHLVLELTESCFADEESGVAQTLSTLRAGGIRLAIDDFGTGYSSLGRLQQLPSDIVKIDRSFITSIHNNSYNYNFVKAVIALCHNAGLRVCVEGIETQDELRTVNNLYADTCQGYYTSKPLDADTFARELIAHPDCFQSRSARADKQERNNTMLSDNDLLRTMMNATPLSINVWNEKFENMACNTAVVELFDLRNEGEYLERFFELSPPCQPDGRPSSEVAYEKISQAFREGRTVFPWMHQKLDGTPIPAEITLVRMPYQKGYIVAGYTRDLRPQENSSKTE